MDSITRWVCTLVAAGTTALAMAQGSPEAGGTKAPMCFACHGPNGNGAINELWPVLAGQNEAYIAGQLKAFHDNGRINSNNVMPPMTAALSAQDMQDVGAFFARQVPTGFDTDKASAQAGEKLYRAGDAARKLPACMACHGPLGHGNPVAGYPALRAQHAAYVAKQLTDYAADQRYARDAKGDSAGGGSAETMHTIAARLTADEIHNLAAYVQNLR